MSVYNITQILYHLFTSNTNYKIMSFNIQTVLFCAVKFVQTAAICCKKFPSFFILSITHAPLFFFFSLSFSPALSFFFLVLLFFSSQPRDRLERDGENQREFRREAVMRRMPECLENSEPKKKKKKERKEKRNEIRLD
jgi:hypothetical protein